MTLVPYKLRHKFQSGKSDPSDTSLVGATRWNEDHDIFLGFDAQTGTTFTFTDDHKGAFITFSNAAAIAAALPQAGGSSQFVAGWYCWVENTGAGKLTITPTTSTIAGAASLDVTQGQGVMIVSDGTNYHVFRGMMANILFSQLASGALAGTSDIWANVSNKLLTIDKIYAALAIQTLTDGATVTPDFNTGIDFTWTIGGARTLANPSNPKVGQCGIIYLVQDATGGRTIASWGTYYKFSQGSKPGLSSAASAVDMLFYNVKSSTEIECALLGGMS